MTDKYRYILRDLRGLIDPVAGLAASRVILDRLPRVRACLDSRLPPFRKGRGKGGAPKLMLSLELALIMAGPPGQVRLENIPTSRKNDGLSGPSARLNSTISPYLNVHPRGRAFP
jgi:hypothetical protein